MSADHICPWWLAYTFDNPLRRLFHNPAKMLGPYVGKGASVADIGSGMGYFSIGMARLVGHSGTVHSVDLQQKMLDISMKRAKGAGVGDIIKPHLCTSDNLGLKGGLGFILCFWMVHEVPDRVNLFGQLWESLESGGNVLMAEPRMHVSGNDFEASVAIALNKGFIEHDRPKISLSRSILLKKP